MNAVWFTLGLLLGDAGPNDLREEDGMTRERAIKMLQSATKGMYAEDGWPLDEYCDAVWTLNNARWSLESEIARERARERYRI